VGGDERRGPESYTWPLLVVVVAVLPQALIPAQHRVGPPLVVPVIETVALLGLLAIVARPGPVPRRAHSVVLVLFGLLVVANTLAAARLVTLVLEADGEADGVALTAGRLLVAALLVLAVNVVTFALLYWELDGGGPAGRIAEPAPFPDFQFPQTVTEGLAEPGWRPHFGDHLYVAFTNLVALSPTDTLPLTRRVKGLMALQSMISLGVLVVVLARVINILPG
jgi:uncharacterized membrane protein